ncbi:MAG: esterase/lipase family protein [Prochlorococcaceae cyanobacterium]|jgi:triacylglycerol lipase
MAPDAHSPLATSPALAPAPPLVLVHGMWDTPRLFDRLKRLLAGRRGPLLIPQLPHRFGITPIEEQAELLRMHIEAAFGREQAIDLLGFSMGGVIGRTWIQLLGGHRRTRRLISVGSPQQGTLTARPWPGRLLAGIADLKTGSALLRRLNDNLDTLLPVECCSFYCQPDLMVMPPWRARLPIGPGHSLPVWSHHQLMTHAAALCPLVEELLRP